MLDIKQIVNEKSRVIAALKKRGVVEAVGAIEEILALNDGRKQAQKETEELAQEMNSRGKEIARLSRENLAAAEQEKKILTELKQKHRVKQEELRDYEDRLKELLVQLPNLPYDEVPAGGVEQNKVIKEVAGSSVVVSENLKPHWELAERFGLVSFDDGSKITGSGFPVYKGKGAALQRALISFFLNRGIAAGYEEVQPPLIINENSAFGTGQLPDKEGVMYKLANGPGYLIPTAEVPITNLYRDMLLDRNKLPIRHIGYTPCFRREAGSAGSKVRGLNRLHQFDKVELVEVHEPTTSKKGLESMLEYVTKLLDELGLRYRILQLASGDLGFTSAITYDLEVWSAGQKKWLEVSSVSSFDSYQARRMKLRYRDGKQNVYCHTLNGSALALPRVVAALLEQNQTKDTIRIPKVLAHYTGWDFVAIAEGR